MATTEPTGKPPTPDLAQSVNRYFTHIAGDVIAASRFTDELTGWMLKEDEADAAKLYDRLYYHVNGVTEDIFYGSLGDGTLQLVERDPLADAAYNHTLDNARLGTGLAIGGLAAIGAAYETRANAPQTRQTVWRSVSHVLGRIHGLAYINRRDADFTRVAYQTGLDPRTITYEDFWRYRRSIRLDDPDVVHPLSQESLTVIDDPDSGQLTVKLRYPARPSQFDDGYCPATMVKAQTEAGRRPALQPFLRIIGQVAVDTIYRRQFAMTE